VPRKLRGEYPGAKYTMSDKIKMRDGDTLLIMVKGGEVIHLTCLLVAGR